MTRTIEIDGITYTRTEEDTRVYYSQVMDYLEEIMVDPKLYDDRADFASMAFTVALDDSLVTYAEKAEFKSYAEARYLSKRIVFKFDAEVDGYVMVKV